MPDRIILLDELRITGASGTLALLDPYAVAPGSGGGGPFPDPSPLTGGPYFGTFNIPYGGAGYWNITVAPIRASTAASVISEARAGGVHLLIMAMGPGGNSSAGFNPGGQYNHQRCLALIQEVANSPSANAAVEAGLADGTVVGFYDFDEPLLSSRYGRVVGWNEIEEIIALEDSLWGPNLRHYLRIAGPTSVSRHVNGLTAIWMTYRTTRGTVTTFRDREVAAARNLGHLVVPSMNVIHMNGAGSDNDNDPAAWATPSQVRDYGYVLSDTPPDVCEPLLITWQFQNNFYDQPGMAQAHLDLRTRFVLNQG